jgi:hypothetical protein
VQTTVVRYETKPECAEENERLVAKVYAELQEIAPDGFSYATFRLDDGVTFVHIARDAGTSGFALADVAAFKDFVSAVADRCVVPPVALNANVVGSYHFFRD